MQLPKEFEERMKNIIPNYDKFLEEVSEKIEKVILHMEAEYHENEESATNINN